jgi:hypothetical protein
MDLDLELIDTTVALLCRADRFRDRHGDEHGGRRRGAREERERCGSQGDDRQRRDALGRRSRPT